MGKKNAEKSKEKETTEESYSYYEDSEYEDEDKEEQCEERDRAKDRAKFRGARSDSGDSSDGGSSPHNNGSAVASRKELKRPIKAARKSTADKRQQKQVASAQEVKHGSAVANRKKTKLSCSEPGGAAVARQSSRRSAVAEPSSRGSTVVSSDKHRCAPERLVNDLKGDLYGNLDIHQNFGGIEEINVRTFRARQERRGDPNQRNRETHFPLSVWMVAKDCEPEKIDKLIFDKSAKNPHALVIFVDMADEEQSKAHDHLCMLADGATEERVSCSDSKEERVSCSDSKKRVTKGHDGPKKTVNRLGRDEKTFGFVVIHNGWISRAMYDDHQDLHKDVDDLLRFGTLHVSMAPSNHDENEKTICIGIASVRRSACGTTSLERSDAQMLARWTNKETHDMVITCTGRNRCGEEFREFWHCFGIESGAKHGCPIYQPLDKQRSAVATKASASDGGRTDKMHAAPQLVFLYGDCTKVNMPWDEHIEPFGESCMCDDQLLECMVETSEIPSWLPPPRTDLAHRQALGEVSVKAIQWDKSSDSVLPLYFFIDHPSKTITHNNSDDKGKGTGTSSHKGKSIHTENKGKDKRTPTQRSRPQQPTCPPPRTESPTRPPYRRARSALPRRRSPPPSRVPQSPSRSHLVYRAVSCSDVRRPQTTLPAVSTTPKWSAVAPTNNVSRPAVRLHPNQQSKAAVQHPPPSRNQCVERHTTARRRSSIAHEPPYVERDKMERAKYVANYASPIRRKYHRWTAAGGDKRAAGSDKRSHTEDSNCAEEDAMSLLWEGEEFETKQKETFDTQIRVKPPNTGGDSRRRSRSPARKPTRPQYISTEYRRPPAEHAKSYPWTQQSSSSKSVRADPPANAQSRKPARSPRRRDRSPPQSVIRKQPQAPHANDVVRNAKRPRFP